MEPVGWWAERPIDLEPHRGYGAIRPQRTGIHNQREKDHNHEDHRILGAADGYSP